ncbi:MAG TPA: hypothetical protein VN823_04245 [Stellaceae bacterium]|nr:hypothetical protein [Stellaceae bacterium]
MLRTALRLAAIGGVDGLFARTGPTPLAPADDFGFQWWLDRVRGALSAPSAIATVIWPQLISRKRIYVHLMSPSGTPIAFCKIGLDPSTAASLENELDALTALRQLGMAVTRIPRILHHETVAGYRYVVYESLPPDLVPLKHSWHELAPSVSEVSGRARWADRAELDRYDWWRSFVRGSRRHSTEFLRDVDETTARPMAVCRVQGDATPSNIFRSKAGIWICDWEFSSSSGPRRTDELSYYLAANHYQCLIRPAATLAACLRRFAAEHDRESIGELALALAFLCGRGDPRALKLASHWRLVSHAPARQSDAQIGPTSAPYRFS